MIHVIVTDTDMTAIADKIREKTQLAQKFRVSDMADAIGTLHGYYSEATGQTLSPAAAGTGAFALSELAQATTAQRAMDYPHAEPLTAFALSELIFSATGAKTE